MEKVFQLKIQLRGIEPPIWRRVLVPADFTLYQLHKVIQIVMGWWDYHLHEFVIDGKRYGRPVESIWEDEKVYDENEYRLKDLIKRAGKKFMYEYDFGDSWRHDIKVEKTLKKTPDLVVPQCIDGERAAPPEDVGGIPGYYGLVEAMKNPGSEDYEYFIEWLGEEYDPETFDMDEINRKLKKLKS